MVFEEDVSELGKTLDVLEDEAKKNEEEDKDSVIIEEITQQKDGWRHEYYVVLGFFLVFMAFFLIVIAVLVYKLKQNNKVSKQNLLIKPLNNCFPKLSSDHGRGSGSAQPRLSTWWPQSYSAESSR